LRATSCSRERLRQHFVTVTTHLDGSVSGSGAILYVGHPTSVTTNITGSGTITGG